MKCTAEPLAIENDGMLDQEEENCFSKLVMIASRTSDERNHSHRKNQKVGFFISMSKPFNRNVSDKIC